MSKRPQRYKLAGVFLGETEVLGTFINVHLIVTVLIES